MQKKIIFFLCYTILIQHIYPLYSYGRNPCSIKAVKHRIAILGTGYVGLVTGACLAKFGHDVICADIASEKIESLKQGVIPIYEPGLDTIVKEQVANNRLTFTTNIPDAIQKSEIIFIAVGTPMSDTGAADLSAIESALNTIVNNLNGYKVIVTKSTVPIGTGKWIRQLLYKHYGISNEQCDIVSNPEFLREGTAVNDFLHPDRIVIGVSSSKACTIMKEVYATLLNEQIPYIITNIVSAETIKYASNAFLATKISFINEIANLCDKAGADIKTIAYGMGLDHRISPQFLQPGPGFGGSCFPKDAQALLCFAKNNHISLHTVNAALETNELQKYKPIEKLVHLMHDNIKDKTIAVLGLSFKANTDDIRYSPAEITIRSLLNKGAHVKAYDPAAMDNMRAIFPTITYCNSIDEAVQEAHAVIVMTEWDVFKSMDLGHIASLMKEKILVDARNILDPDKLTSLGFLFDTIGRSYLCTRKIQ